MVKKIIALVMGIIILIAATELHQLVKLPILIKHYIHHQQEDPAISFICFLKIHYSIGQHPNDNDDQEDNELPFKSSGDLYHIDMPLIEKKFATGHIMYPQLILETRHPEGNPNGRSFSIFHPPQLV